MFEKLMKNADWIAIPFGIIALTLSFAGIDNHYLIWFIRIAGAMAVIYTIYALYLFIFRRPMFDWHLLHGHFLRKVFSLILLTPFLLTAATYIWIKNPKEMVFDENLYECKENSLPCDIKKEQESPNIFWSTYYHFIDPGNQHMTTTKTGRIYSALVAILGMFLLNGLLVSSIIGWIDRRKEELTKGEVRYKIWHLGRSRFAIVFGANEIASSVIRNLLTPKRKGEINYKCEGNNRYVILQTSRKADKVRTELASHLNEEELKKVIIYKAQRDSIEEIENLGLRYSTEIYILGESAFIDGGETYHDAMNMRCANMIAVELEQSRKEREEQKKKKGCSVRKVCKVMFEYQTTSSIFQFSDISKLVKDNLIFIPFNRYESWARKVIVDGTCEGIDYTPLDGKGIQKDSNEFVHLVIVGMSKMGVALGVEALQQAHYLNSDRARTRITFIDTNADKEMAFFKGRYANMFELVRHRYVNKTKADDPKSNENWTDPMAADSCKWKHLSEDGENFLDVEIEFIKGEIESEGIRDYLKQLSLNRNAKLTMAICLTYTHQAVAAALYMPMEVYKNDRLQQIWVYQRESEDIISNLNNECNDLRYKKMRPFGMLYGEYMSDRALYLKALLVNVAYSITNNYNKVGWPKDILDKKDAGYVEARKSWKTLSIDKRWSNKYYADSIYIKIRNILINKDEYSSPQKVMNLLNNDFKNTIDTISKAIEENSKPLSVCEHNRWNIQQLMLGYSPCDKELDQIFNLINNGRDKELIKERYIKWKEIHLHDSSCDKKIKDDVKESALRIHPNLCSYNHLDEVDSGAKKYDSDMNAAITRIISIIDRHNLNSKDKQ